MKHFTIITSCTMLLGAAANAGNLEQPAVDPVVVTTVETTPSAITDWSGFYAGISASAYEAESEYSDAPQPGIVDETSNFGAFAGYNWQSQRFVYGGALHAVSGFTGVSDFVNGDFEDEFSPVISLRARGGYVLGQALLYGFVGYAVSDYTIPGAPDEPWDLDGMTYGIGADYLVTDHIFAGLEVSALEIDGNPDLPFLDESHKVTQESVTFRVGYKF